MTAKSYHTTISSHRVTTQVEDVIEIMDTYRYPRQSIPPEPTGAAFLHVTIPWHFLYFVGLEYQNRLFTLFKLVDSWFKQSLQEIQCTATSTRTQCKQTLEPNLTTALEVCNVSTAQL
ncbi:hypothetical protein CEK26_005557 [Fusarium fujikuroi]|uniref:Uncharacterized protein n=1 Tax=Fusarium fujikuroi TaxID=5127 RepID=A0A5Q3EIK6_FUSFU|nr:hypothetical protein CEK27_005560 [Fusarium fujikuroi]QGI78776.1 hypothetical protein CEK25_005505 [Fusarium fujikuroi]QGI92488.1 hypothetical protein CEK26_005557 [Fusarium fujikuroi]VTT69883.1 unnamed protein product [Fusarium fujikuroi]VTT76133.1 unnamed protein product [Fusarium fujikuroi]